MKNKKADSTNLIPGKLYVYPKIWEYLNGDATAKLLGHNKICPMVFHKYVVYHFMNNGTDCQDNVLMLSADTKISIREHYSYSNDNPFHISACFVFYDFYESRQRKINLKLGKEIVFYNF